MLHAKADAIALPAPRRLGWRLLGWGVILAIWGAAARTVSGAVSRPRAGRAACGIKDRPGVLPMGQPRSMFPASIFCGSRLTLV
jgi:hypothetical protein